MGLNFLTFEDCLTITNFIALMKEESFWFSSEEKKEFLYHLFDANEQGHFTLSDFKERFLKMSI